MPNYFYTMPTSSRKRARPGEVVEGLLMAAGLGLLMFAATFGALAYEEEICGWASSGFFGF